MSAKAFWTPKRLEAVSRTSLTLFQAFSIAGLLGGAWGKIPGIWLKSGFVMATVVLCIAGVVFSDWPLKKET